MTTQLATAQTARIRALIVVGVALVTAGLYSIVTLLYSVFARYMYVEDLDLGLDENTVFVLTRITPTDRGILILGGALLLLYLKESLMLFLSKKISILHWFLYLCAVEIFPVSFVWLSLTRI